MTDKTQDQMSRLILRLSTPAAAASFLVVATSGVMMFFHLAQHQVESLHEWAGLVMVTAAGLHATRHWRALTGYARRGNSLQISLSFAALGAAAFLAAALLGGERGGLDAMRVKVQHASLIELAPILEEAPEKLVARLQSSGLSGVTLTASPEEIASASGKSSREVLQVIADPK